MVRQFADERDFWPSRLIDTPGYEQVMNSLGGRPVPGPTLIPGPKEMAPGLACFRHWDMLGTPGVGHGTR